MPIASWSSRLTRSYPKEVTTLLKHLLAQPHSEMRQVILHSQQLVPVHSGFCVLSRLNFIDIRFFLGYCTRQLQKPYSTSKVKWLRTGSSTTGVLSYGKGACALAVVGAVDLHISVCL